MAEETFCILRPRLGATHAPDTVGGPWSYEHGGEEKSIFRHPPKPCPTTFEAGDRLPSPREMPRGEAERALQYFTPSDGVTEPLVEIEYHQGERETVFLPTVTKFRDPATGSEYDSVEELSKAIEERVTGSADGGGGDATPPKTAGRRRAGTIDPEEE